MELHCLTASPPSYRLETAGPDAAALLLDCPHAALPPATFTSAAVLVSSCAGLAWLPLLTEKSGYDGSIYVTGPVAAVKQTP